MSASDHPRAGDKDVTEIAASQGRKTFHIRWVLVVSLLLAIIAVGLSYIWYVSAQSARTAQATPGAVTQEERSTG
jgi:hypothetical protein